MRLGFSKPQTSTWFEKRAKHRPQMVQNGPKMTPEMSQMCPKWGQNGPDGPKMIKKGPWEGARGQQEGNREPEGSPPWTPHPFWGSKIGQNPSKTCLKTWWFSSRSLDRFWCPFYTKMVPQRVKFETNIDQKIASCQKNEFSLPHSKNLWILMNFRVRGLHLWS